MAAPSHDGAPFAVPTPAQALSTDPSRIEIPLEFSSLKEVHHGSGNTFIIHIQDAHSNLSGQENLAKTLDDLMGRYHVSLVLVEAGSPADGSLTPLKKIASPEATRRAARSLLVEGKIAGEEYLNLVSDHPMKIRGVEDMALYRESVENYAALAEKREAILEYLQTIRAAVEKLKRKCYPNELLEYENLKPSLRAQRSNLSGLFNDAEIASSPSAPRNDVEKLLAFASKNHIDLKNFPAIQKLSDLHAAETKIDFNLANLEQAALVEAVRKSGGGEALGDYLAKAGRLRDDRAAQYAYLQNLFAIAHEKNVSVGRYSNILRYADYLKAFSALDLDEVTEESGKLEDAVYLSVIASEAKQSHNDSEIASSPSAPRNDAESALLIRSLDRYLGLLETAYRIQMSSREFETFEANEKDFLTADTLAFVNRRLAELGYVDDLIPYKNLLEEGKTRLKAFYGSVARRDVAFMRNIDRILKEENQKVAVLITGGYHTEHLKTLMREKDYSFAVVAPIVTAPTDQKKYERLLLSAMHENTADKKPEFIPSKTAAQDDRVLWAAGRDIVSDFVAKLDGPYDKKAAEAAELQLAAARLASAAEAWRFGKLAEDINEALIKDIAREVKPVVRFEFVKKPLSSSGMDADGFMLSSPPYIPGANRQELVIYVNPQQFSNYSAYSALVMAIRRYFGINFRGKAPALKEVGRKWQAKKADASETAPISHPALQTAQKKAAQKKNFSLNVGQAFQDLLAEHAPSLLKVGFVAAVTLSAAWLTTRLYDSASPPHLSQFVALIDATPEKAFENPGGSPKAQALGRIDTELAKALQRTRLQNASRYRDIKRIIFESAPAVDGKTQALKITVEENEPGSAFPMFGERTISLESEQALETGIQNAANNLYGGVYDGSLGDATKYFLAGVVGFFAFLASGLVWFFTGTTERTRPSHGDADLAKARGIARRREAERQSEGARLAKSAERPSTPAPFLKWLSSRTVILIGNLNEEQRAAWERKLETLTGNNRLDIAVGGNLGRAVDILLKRVDMKNPTPPVGLIVYLNRQRDQILRNPNMDLFDGGCLVLNNNLSGIPLENFEQMLKAALGKSVPGTAAFADPGTMRSLARVFLYSAQAIAQNGSVTSPSLADRFLEERQSVRPKMRELTPLSVERALQEYLSQLARLGLLNKVAKGQYSGNGFDYVLTDSGSKLWETVESSDREAALDAIAGELAKKTAGARLSDLSFKVDTAESVRLPMVNEGTPHEYYWTELPVDVSRGRNRLMLEALLDRSETRKIEPLDQMKPRFIIAQEPGKSDDPVYAALVVSILGGIPREKLNSWREKNVFAHQIVVIDLVDFGKDPNSSHLYDEYESSSLQKMLRETGSENPVMITNKTVKSHRVLVEHDAERGLLTLRYRISGDAQARGLEPAGVEYGRYKRFTLRRPMTKGQILIAVHTLLESDPDMEGKRVVRTIIGEERPNADEVSGISPQEMAKIIDAGSQITVYYQDPAEPSLLNFDIKAIELRPDVEYALRKHGIISLGDLTLHPPAELLSFDEIKEPDIKTIREFFKRYGLSFRDTQGARLAPRPGAESASLGTAALSKGHETPRVEGARLAHSFDVNEAQKVASMGTGHLHGLLVTIAAFPEWGGDPRPLDVIDQGLVDKLADVFEQIEVHQSDLRYVWPAKAIALIVGLTRERGIPPPGIMRVEPDLRFKRHLPVLIHGLRNWMIADVLQPAFVFIGAPAAEALGKLLDGDNPFLNNSNYFAACNSAVGILSLMTPEDGRPALKGAVTLLLALNLSNSEEEKLQEFILRYASEAAPLIQDALRSGRPLHGAYPLTKLVEKMNDLAEKKMTGLRASRDLGRIELNFNGGIVLLVLHKASMGSGEPQDPFMTHLYDISGEFGDHSIPAGQITIATSPQTGGEAGKLTYKLQHVQVTQAALGRLYKPFEKWLNDLDITEWSIESLRSSFDGARLADARLVREIIRSNSKALMGTEGFTFQDLKRLPALKDYSDQTLTEGLALAKKLDGLSDRTVDGTVRYFIHDENEWEKNWSRYRPSSGTSGARLAPRPGAESASLGTAALSKGRETPRVEGARLANFNQGARERHENKPAARPIEEKEPHLSADEKKFLTEKENIVLLSPPGAGKGTLTEWLKAELEGAADIGTGNFFRGAKGFAAGQPIVESGEARDSNLDIFKKDRLEQIYAEMNRIIAKHQSDLDRMNAGGLIDDATTIEIVNFLLSQEEYRRAKVRFFDGFPRSPVQWDAVEAGDVKIGGPEGRPLKAGLSIALEFTPDTMEQTIRQRFLKRGRSEDSDKAIERIRTYNEQTAPVLELAKRGDILLLNADDRPGTTQESIAAARRDFIRRLEKMRQTQEILRGARLAAVIPFDAHDASKAEDILHGTDPDLRSRALEDLISGNPVIRDLIERERGFVKRVTPDMDIEFVKPSAPSTLRPVDDQLIIRTTKEPNVEVRIRSAGVQRSYYEFEWPEGEDSISYEQFWNLPLKKHEGGETYGPFSMQTVFRRSGFGDFIKDFHLERNLLFLYDKKSKRLEVYKGNPSLWNDEEIISATRAKEYWSINMGHADSIKRHFEITDASDRQILFKLHYHPRSGVSPWDSVRASKQDMVSFLDHAEYVIPEVIVGLDANVGLYVARKPVLDRSWWMESIYTYDDRLLEEANSRIQRELKSKGYEGFRDEYFSSRFFELSGSGARLASGSFEKLMQTAADRSEDYRARTAAATELGDIYETLAPNDRRRALRRLIEARSNDSSGTVQQAAKEALQKIGGEEALFYVDLPRDSQQAMALPNAALYLEKTITDKELLPTGAGLTALRCLADASEIPPSRAFELIAAAGKAENAPIIVRETALRALGALAPRLVKSGDYRSEKGKAALEAGLEMARQTVLQNPGGRGGQDLRWAALNSLADLRRAAPEDPNDGLRVALRKYAIPVFDYLLETAKRPDIFVLVRAMLPFGSETSALLSKMINLDFPNRDAQTAMLAAELFKTIGVRDDQISGQLVSSVVNRAADRHFRMDEARVMPPIRAALDAVRSLKPAPIGTIFQLEKLRRDSHGDLKALLDETLRDLLAPTPTRADAATDKLLAELAETHDPLAVLSISMLLKDRADALPQAESDAADDALAEALAVHLDPADPALAKAAFLGLHEISTYRAVFFRKLWKWRTVDIDDGPESQTALAAVQNVRYPVLVRARALEAASDSYFRGRMPLNEIGDPVLEAIRSGPDELRPTALRVARGLVLDRLMYLYKRSWDDAFESQTCAPLVQAIADRAVDPNAPANERQQAIDALDEFLSYGPQTGLLRGQLKSHALTAATAVLNEKNAESLMVATALSIATSLGPQADSLIPAGISRLKPAAALNAPWAAPAIRFLASRECFDAATVKLVERYRGSASKPAATAASQYLSAHERFQQATEVIAQLGRLRRGLKQRKDVRLAMDEARSLRGHLDSYPRGIRASVSTAFDGFMEAATAEYERRLDDEARVAVEPLVKFHANLWRRIDMAAARETLSKLYENVPSHLRKSAVIADEYARIQEAISDLTAHQAEELRDQINAVASGLGGSSDLDAARAEVERLWKRTKKAGISQAVGVQKKMIVSDARRAALTKIKKMELRQEEMKAAKIASDIIGKLDHYKELAGSTSPADAIRAVARDSQGRLKRSKIRRREAKRIVLGASETVAAIVRHSGARLASIVKRRRRTEEANAAWASISERWQRISQNEARGEYDRLSKVEAGRLINELQREILFPVKELMARYGQLDPRQKKFTADELEHVRNAAVNAQNRLKARRLGAAGQNGARMAGATPSVELFRDFFGEIARPGVAFASVQDLAPGDLEVLGMIAASKGLAEGQDYTMDFKNGVAFIDAKRPDTIEFYGKAADGGRGQYKGSLTLTPAEIEKGRADLKAMRERSLQTVAAPRQLPAFVLAADQTRLAMAHLSSGEKVVLNVIGRDVLIDQPEIRQMMLAALPFLLSRGVFVRFGRVEGDKFVSDEAFAGLNQNIPDGIKLQSFIGAEDSLRRLTVPPDAGVELVQKEPGRVIRLLDTFIRSANMKRDKSSIRQNLSALADPLAVRQADDATLIYLHAVPADFNLHKDDIFLKLRLVAIRPLELNLEEIAAYARMVRSFLTAA